MAKTLVVHVEGNQCFYAADGKCIASLNDLQKSLGEMDDNTYYHHANDARNDFANWAHDVLQDAELASQLKEAKDRKTAQIVVLKRVLQLVRELLG
jgi:hypothetical protein